VLNIGVNALVAGSNTDLADRSQYILPILSQPQRRAATCATRLYAHSVVNGPLDGDEDVDEGGTCGDHCAASKKRKEWREMERDEDDKR
jgi:hypothetical protein